MIDTDKYEGHDLSTDEKMNDAIEYIQGSIFHDEDEGRIAEANAQLIADAPLLLEHVKCLTKTLELIGKNMPYDSWMHTLIKGAIGYEKWQAKEARKNDRNI